MNYIDCKNVEDLLYQAAVSLFNGLLVNVVIAFVIGRL